MKKAIILGSNGAIGKSIVKYLFDEGYYLDLFDFNIAERKIFSEKINFYELDLSDPKSVVEKMNSYSSEIDISLIINCSGIHEWSSLIDLPHENILNLLNINFLGYFEFLRYFIKNNLFSLNDEYSKIISFSSTAGFSYRPLQGWYSISKHMLELMHDFLSIELNSRKNKLVLIQPSTVRTNMNDVSLANALKNKWNLESDYFKILSSIQNGKQNRSNIEGDYVEVEEIVDLIKNIVRIKNPDRNYTIGNWAKIIYEDSKKEKSEIIEFYKKMLKDYEKKYEN